MGYTHYWSVKADIAEDAWKKIVHDVRKLVAAFPEPIEFEAHSDVFGVFPGYCESLVLKRAKCDFGHCKTMHSPADKLICAILSVAALASPAIDVSSDAQMGSKPDGWPKAARWATKILGYEVKPPWRYKRVPLWRYCLRKLGLG